jgi:virulence factor Mce-like protein
MNTRKFVLGIVYLSLIAAAAVLSLAMNRGALESKVTVTIATDRAGLTMTPGARIKLRGVDVGRVAAVKPTARGAAIQADLFPSQVGNVPANVSAQIIPPTAFGAKYVQLTVPSGDRDDAIRAGAVIRSDHVTVEFNDTFENLTEVLKVARPDKVNRALTAGSSVLDGRGEKIGALVVDLERYLTEFNRTLPALSKDVELGNDVLRTYDRLTPDALALAKNVTTSSRTVAQEHRSLHDLLMNSQGLSDDLGGFLDTNQPGIKKVVDLYEPVTGTLARYSPEIPCLLGGLVQVNDLMEDAFGGRKPGWNAYLRLRPGQAPWKYPVNLPVVREDRGPACYGLPLVGEDEAKRPMPRFAVGANPPSESQPPLGRLSGTFFGSLAGLVNPS